VTTLDTTRKAIGIITCYSRLKKTTLSEKVTKAIFRRGGACCRVITITATSTGLGCAIKVVVDCTLCAFVDIRATTSIAILIITY